MKVVLLGGTKGMGRSLARAMAERGHEIFLLGRDASDLARSAADLEIRSNQRRKIGVAVCDLEDPSTFRVALNEADHALGGYNAVVVTAGQFGTQEQLEADPELAHRVLTTNFSNTVLFCEQARRPMQERGGGTLCVFSSVAGERGRKPVVLYGASKAGLTHYLEGLDHKFRGEGLRTVCVKPGFVKTGMTTGLKPPPFAGEPDQVAKLVLRGIERGTPVVYAPPIWSLIMMVIRALPRFVMRRIGF